MSELQSMIVASFKGKPREEIDRLLDDADLGHVADELADELARRLSGATFPFEQLTIRLIYSERDGVYERAVELNANEWTMTANTSRLPDLILRCEGMAPFVACANGDMHVQTTILTGICQTEGPTELRDAVVEGLARATDDPTAAIFALRGLSDRQLERRLRDIDIRALVFGMIQIGVEVAGYFGNGADIGRRIVSQLEVPYAGETCVAQTVLDGGEVVVFDHIVTTPTITCRFKRAIDFVRVCIAEVQPLDLVVTGKVQVEGDLSMFADVDMLRLPEWR